MTTLYSSAVTIKGKKHKSVSFALGYDEREAIKILIAGFAAIKSLEPDPFRIRCGDRVNKSYCTAVAQGLTELTSIDDEEILLVDGDDLKQLKKAKRAVDAVFENITDNTRRAELSGEAIANLVEAGEVFSAYANLGVDTISINNYSITRQRVKELVEFLNGVKRNVLFK